MKNPFESPVLNYCILAASMGLGMYFAAQEKDISFFGIIFLGAIVGFVIYVAIKFPFMMHMEYRRRVDNGIDLDAVLETDPEVVKAHMWVLMQNRFLKGFEGTLEEFSDIFRNYPQWELDKWVEFRAWYKDFIDNHVLKYPEIYDYRLKNGEPYSTEKDPLYDPTAPDWSEFALPELDDDDYDDYDDDYDGGGNNGGLFNSKSEAFGFGIGMGLMGGSIGSASSGG